MEVDWALHKMLPLHLQFRTDTNDQSSIVTFATLSVLEPKGFSLDLFLISPPTQNPKSD